MAFYFFAGLWLLSLDDALLSCCLARHMQVGARIDCLRGAAEPPPAAVLEQLAVQLHVASHLHNVLQHSPQRRPAATCKGRWHSV